MPPTNKDKQSEGIEFEISFYEKLLHEQPRFLQAMRALAELYTKVGRYQDGLELDTGITQLAPDDPVAFYNLACSHSLLNNVANGIQALEKACELGYKDFSFLLKDPDLVNVRADKQFSTLLQNYHTAHE